MNSKKIFIVMIILLISFQVFVCEIRAETLTQRLNGRILLQVEENGEAWYVYPVDQRRYYLGRPADAFRIMRELGLGISTKDFNSYGLYAPNKLAGKILLKVEENGEAYYVYPLTLKMYYLGRPADAFRIMRELGLGISTTDLNKISAYQEVVNKPQDNTVVDNRDDEVEEKQYSDDYSQIERDAFDLVNDYRVSKGLNRLVWNNDVLNKCREHSTDMADGGVGLGHDGFEERATYLREKISINGAAENVAYNLGYADPAEKAYSSWVNSLGHRENILGDYTASAIGIAKSRNGSYYFTQIFIKTQ